MVVFVKNKHGEALMPCSERKARLLLRDKKAKIIECKSFTVQLMYGLYGYKQPTAVGIDLIKKNTENILMFKQVRKKKRSLHEATARKGRKEKNTTAKRNSKNTPKVGDFHLYDTVSVNGIIGFISGFSGKTQCYVKDFHGEYVTISPKYKMVGLKKLNRLAHNNNWIQQRTPAYAG